MLEQTLLDFIDSIILLTRERMNTYFILETDYDRLDSLWELRETIKYDRFLRKIKLSELLSDTKMEDSFLDTVIKQIQKYRSLEIKI